MQFSTKIDGFEQKDSQGFENSYNSYEQYPLEKFFIFTIYQNYTLALIHFVCLPQNWPWLHTDLYNLNSQISTLESSQEPHTGKIDVWTLDLLQLTNQASILTLCIANIITHLVWSGEMVIPGPQCKSGYKYLSGWPSQIGLRRYFRIHGSPVSEGVDYKSFSFNIWIGLLPVHVQICTL